MNSRIGSLPPREHVTVENGWRVAHAFDSSLRGWLVLLPLRHVHALDELSDDEGAALGRLLVRLSAALRRAVSCEKTYTMLFAEAPGFSHLHLHLVPRMSTFTAAQAGPQVFTFLGKDVGERVEDDEQDELSRRIASLLRSYGGGAPTATDSAH